MAVRLGDAFVGLGTKDELDKGLNAARAKVNGWLSNITQGIAQGVGQAVAQGVGNLIRSGIDEMRKSVEAASDLNESLSKTQVAFGDSSREVLEWSKTSSNAFGQSRQQALEAASTFGLLFSSMGVTREESVKMSKSLVELASDIASINNLSPEDALLKLRSGLVGETEPLRTVGVLLNATTVEAKALALGLADSTDALTEQDKVMARYQLILEQTALTQGDFARTADQAANSDRILAATLADSSARLGRFWLPVRTALAQGATELITTIAPYGENIMDSLASGLARGIVSILPVLQQVRALFVYWLKPGSPPRLLKELTDWGKSAMGEYLRGWTLADFSALTNLGGIFESALRSFASSGDIQETDLIGRVFGTQKALTQAIRDWRNLGFVTEETFAAINRAAGPAGGAVSGLAREYFELQRVTKRVADAQNELNSITDRYAQALDPITGQLDAVRAKQQEIRDNQRLEELGKIISDPHADIDDRRLARLEAEEIQLERQATALEDERDAALDGAQQKIDAAKQEEAAQQQKFDTAQAILDQQEKTNRLIAEETALRQRLIDEGIAEQKRVLAELEAEQRKAEQAERERLAGLERIADAELRYRLASTDTTGQLEIMRAELAKTTAGSAEYYDILTQIVGLEERLKKEREAGGSGSVGPLQEAIGTPGEIEQTSKGIQALSDALDEAFRVLAGEDGKQAQLAPAWQTFAETLGTIGEAAKEAAPLIQSVVDLVMGKEVEGGATTDPFGDNWWLAGIIPGLHFIISNLAMIRDGDWAGVWGNLKQYVFDTLNTIDPTADPRTFGFYSWLQDIAIPAIEAIAAGDWSSAFTLFATPINTLIDSAYTNGYNFITEFWRGITEGIASLPGDFQEWFRDALRGEGMFVPGPINPHKTRPGEPGQDVLPPSDLSSFPGGVPGIAPLVPAVAGASSVTNGPSIVNQYWINQNIGLNEDIGGARQGAERGIKAAIIDRRLNGDA